jgi:hypothetical protein
MKQLLIQNGNLRTTVSELADYDGVGLLQGSDYVELTWDDAIKVRDWLQLAIAEHTEKVHSQRTLTD